MSLAFLGEVRLREAALGSAGDSRGRLAPLAGSAAVWGGAKGNKSRL